MSKNIVIQEGGTGRQFTAQKIRTSTVDGGSCNWVPEDEVSLSTIRITENGTYDPADEGLYGYSVVTVDVPGGAGSSTPGGAGSSIIGTDGDGDEAVATVNEDGEIETEKLVSYLIIWQVPDKLAYEDGETIDITGIEVVGYTETGSPWRHFWKQQFEQGEIRISPTVANAAQQGDSSFDFDEQTMYILDPNLTYRGEIGSRKYQNGALTRNEVLSQTIQLSCSSCDLVIPLMESNPSRFAYLMVSDSSSASFLYSCTTELVEYKTLNSNGEWVYMSAEDYANMYPDRIGTDTTAYVLDQSYTKNGETVYYCYVSAMRNYEQTVSNTVFFWRIVTDTSHGFTIPDDLPNSPSDLGLLAWEALHSDAHEISTDRIITVQWNRPQDNKLLEAGFTITVSPSSGSQGGGSGSEEAPLVEEQSGGGE